MVKAEVSSVLVDVFKKCLSECPAYLSNLAISQLANLINFLDNGPDKYIIINLVSAGWPREKENNTYDCETNTYHLPPPPPITFKFISCLNRAERKLSCLEAMYDIILQTKGSEMMLMMILCLR